MKYKAILAGLGFTLHIATAQPVPPPQQLLPADTLMVITVPDSAAAAAQWKQHPMRQLWHDPAMDSFRDKLMAAVRSELVQPLESALELGLDRVPKLLQGQLTLALTRNGWPDRHDTFPAFVLLADTGDQSERMADLLADWRKRLEESGIAVTDREIQDRNLFSLALPDGPMELVMGRSGSLFLASTEPGLLEKVIQRQLSGDPAGSLLDHEVFRRDHAAGLQGAHGYAWVDFNPIVRLLTQLARDQEAAGQGALALFQPTKLISTIGIDGLRSLSFGVQFSPEGSHGQFQLGLPEPERRGLMRLLVPEPGESGPLEFVPADVARFQRMRLDMARAWSTLEEMVFTILPAARGVVDLMFQSIGKDVDPDFDLRRELFGNLGNDIVWIERAPTDESPAILSSPPTLILLGSRAPDRVAAALKAAAVLLPPPLNQLDERMVAGRRIYELRLPEMGFESGPGMALGFVGGDGYLGLSTEPDLIEAFARRDHGDGPFLHELPGWKEAITKVGGTSNGFFGYENDRLTAQTLFETLKSEAWLLDQMLTLAPDLPLDGVTEGRRLQDWLDFSLLPPFDQVARYFDFSVYGVSLRSDGVSYRMFTPKPRPAP